MTAARLLGKIVLLAVGIVTMIPATNSTAAIVIDIIESGANVQATLSGSINLSATTGQIGTSTGYNGFVAALGGVSFTTGNSEFYGVNVATWTPFGPGDFSNWSTSSGNPLHLFTDPVIGVPVGYQSGSSLSANATSLGASFASLGFTPGSYVTTLTNGAVTDTVTVNIGQASPAVPEPASMAIWGIGALGCAIAGYRRRKLA